MRKFFKFFAFIYKYFYLFMLLLGGLCIGFYKQIMEIFPYIATGLMAGFAITAFIGLLLKVVKKEKKATLVAVLVVALILSALCIIEREETITVIAVIWGIYGLLKGGKEVSNVVKKIQERRSFISSLIQAIFTLTISTILLLEPVAHHVEKHIILLGLEFIIIPLISMDNERNYIFDKVFIMSEEENALLKDAFEKKFPHIKKRKK
ncbi:MAG: hypothetical protein IKC71_01210 [Clostridia bacterium]|nr:hypothetical protein [Clostridia bacterium]